MHHTVGLGDGAHHAAGNAAGEGIGGDILGHHAACADDAAIANGDTGADDDTCPQPAVVADGDGAGVAQVYPLTLTIQHLPPFGGDHGVNGGDDGDIRAEVAVVPDGHGGIVLHGEVEVKKAPLAHGGMNTVVEGDRPLEKGTLPNVSHDLMDDGLSRLLLIFIQAVIVEIELMGAQFHRLKLGISGGKEDPCLDLGLFVHGATSCVGTLEIV